MLTISVLVFIVYVSIALAARDCFQCICQVESQCQPLDCRMDMGSLSCGYFQIKLPYYQDCGTPGRHSGEPVEEAWKRCSKDYSCSLQCIKAYINRYARMCPGKGGCELISKLHNGGPNGCHLERTVGYWQKVQSCCGCA
ncbi:hypothetical protein QR680_005896 [Steinernema hermaphroditum]|uniref:lysozyme n=1 Tax=Steinernema hermaphroditum TaxID=289476 RepID=A0AA39HW22_9BILA|nr:hypothetical protein QR680_005896 [Steinernema hermaphroditum]